MSGEPLDAIEALLPAYALSALEEEDRDLVERALEHDPRYRELLADYLESAAQLASMHQPAVPPASLKSRIMDAHRPLAVSASVSETMAMLSRQHSRPKRTRTTFTIAAAAALVLAVLGLGSFSWMQHQQMQELRAEVGTLAADATEMEQRVLAQQALTYWVAQPDVQAIRIDPVANHAIPTAASAPVSAPRGLFMRSQERDDERVMVVMGMTPLPRHNSYQAWLWDTFGEAYSLGVFEVDDNGYALVSVDYPKNVARPFSLLSVSVEPVGGSVRPSGSTVLMGPVHIE
ncbi:MAG: anti-sigma factor [Dehalococcoidia bacterium]